MILIGYEIGIINKSITRENEKVSICALAVISKAT